MPLELGPRQFVVRDVIYEASDAFLRSHPGGRAVVERLFGRDGTAAFEAVHAPVNLTAHGVERIGPVPADGGAPPPPDDDAAPPADGGAPAIEQLSDAVCLADFEQRARACLSAVAAVYYASGAEDELTLEANCAAWARVPLRPRVLVDVRRVDTAARLLGCGMRVPFYAAPTAVAGLGHPDGELAIVDACRAKGVLYMLPTLSSKPFADMAARLDTARAPAFFQLYVNSDRALTRRLVEQAERAGCQALVVTVDAPCLGRREADLRLRQSGQAASVQQSNNDDDSGGGGGGDKEPTEDRGTSASLSSFIDPSLNWRDIAWFVSITSMPIILKGIQTAEDALLAATTPGVRGIVVSNHGGRQVDGCLASADMLREIVPALERAGLRDRLAVLVDGGVRRGSHVVRALALGADAVGVGRPIIYALSSFGREGVERALDMLRDELVTCMRLVGARSLADLDRRIVERPRL